MREACRRAASFLQQVLEGKEGEKDSLEEAGKQIKKDAQKFQSIAEGTVRGLTQLHQEIQSPNKKEKVLVLVMGWDADLSDAIKKVGKDLEGDTPAPKGDSKGDGEDPLKEKKKIEDSKKTSPAAKKFLDKDMEFPTKSGHGVNGYSVRSYSAGET